MQMTEIKSPHLEASQQIEITPYLLAKNLLNQLTRKQIADYLQDLESQWDGYEVAILMAEFYLEVIGQGIEMSNVDPNDLESTPLLKAAIESFTGN